jgi:taurine dioxygenase
MSMSVTLSERPIGARVANVRLSDLDEDAFRRIRDLVDERSVVAIERQDLSEPQQIAFARRFGELQKIFLKDALSSRYPELFVVSNILENGKPIGSTDAGVYWHTDGAYLPQPHSVSMLYAIEVPEKDGKPVGDTLFAAMGAAYDALPRATRDLVDRLRGVHSLHYRYATKSGAAQDLAELTRKFPPASHPLAIRHPATGRKCLYLSEGYTTGIEGLPEDEGAALLKALCEHVVRPEFQYRYQWAPGDLLIWDNRATLHRATFDYALPQRRLMRRATVSGQAFG